MQTILQITREDLTSLASEVREQTFDWCRSNFKYDYLLPEDVVMTQMGVEMSNKIKRREIRATIGKWKRIGKKWVCSAKSIDKWINES